VELRRLLGIIRQRRWVVLLAFVVTAGVTIALVLSQPFVYESTGTMLLRPRSLGSEAQVDASDLLIRGVKIGATYATIARSDLVRARAEGVLESSEDLDDYTVTAEVLTDTNIISIAVRGPVPELARDLAAAISMETIQYVDEQGDAYVLEQLDEPVVPESPVGPNEVLNIVLGCVFGLFLGVGLALFAQYLSSAAPLAAESRVFDAKTAVYDEMFLRQRLREETSRAERIGAAVGFGWLSVRFRSGEGNGLPRLPAERDLRRLAQAMQLTLGEEAVLARLNDGAFGVLLPDMQKREADGLLSGWHALASSLLDGQGTRTGSRFQVTTATCQLGPGRRRVAGDREATQVVSRLLEPQVDPAPEHRSSRDAIVIDPQVKADPEGERKGPADPSESQEESEVVDGSAPSSRYWRDPSRRRREWKGKTRAGGRTG
jgi:capsular polysaccharide biosynthesis protein